MTWEELRWKYKEQSAYQSNSVIIIKPLAGSRLYIWRNGDVSVCSYATLTTDRTPEQMDEIIKNLTEKQ
jgi:hypothetical protein